MQMKIAVSIPDSVFDAAEKLASERGIPRSRLYAEALDEYLSRHGAESVTARLDQVHGDRPHQLDEAFAAAQHDVIKDEAW